jgi:predicted Zn-dependent protease with MMP-like domain
MADASDARSDEPAGSDDPVAAQVTKAWDAYRLADPEAGIAAAKAALAQESRHGGAWYVMGACHERAGRFGRADRCFHRAAHVNVEPQAMPYRIAWPRFCALVERSAAALPPALGKALGEVTLVLADYAEPALLEEFEERELLGLFTGPTRAERSPTADGADLPPQVHLFRRAHEHTCSTREELETEVRSTLIHEFGHYLGYGEDELEKLGWG